MTNELATTEQNSSNDVLGSMYSSVSATTQEEKLELYSAVSDCDSLTEHVGEVLNLENVIIQPVDVSDPRTGEMRRANRIVVITDKGEAFGCVSSGVETAMKQLFAIVGEPTWSPALPMKVVEKKGRNGYKFTTLEYTPKKSK